MMHSYLYEKWLTDYQEGTLPTADHARMERHIAKCVKCQEIVGAFEFVDNLLTHAKPTVAELNKDQSAAIFYRAAAAVPNAGAIPHPKRKSSNWQMWSFATVGAAALITLVMLNTNNPTLPADSPVTSNNPPSTNKRMIADNTTVRPELADKPVSLGISASTSKPDFDIPVKRSGLSKRKNLQLAQLTNLPHKNYELPVVFSERITESRDASELGNGLRATQPTYRKNGVNAADLPALSVIESVPSLASAKSLGSSLSVKLLDSYRLDSIVPESMGRQSTMTNYAYACSRTTNDEGDVSVKETTQSVTGNRLTRVLKLLVQPNADKQTSQSLTVEAILDDTTVANTKDK